MLEGVRSINRNFINSQENFFSIGAVPLAKNLIGCMLVHETASGSIAGIIVETEAYNEDDEASHAFGGRRTVRNEIMFEAGGHAYVYFIYGMYHCFNVTAGKRGKGEAVLIRALEPIIGIEQMKENRKTENLKNLCSGPGKLCQALCITRKQNGLDLVHSPLKVLVPNKQVQIRIKSSTRIGIKKASHLRWRFFDADSEFVSRHDTGG